MNYLDTYVLIDRKVITYKLLSRLKKIHVREARDEMQSWYQAHRDAQATFIVSGYQVDTKDGKPSQSVEGSMDVDASQSRRMVISLVLAEEVDATKALFEEVYSVGIYSVGPPGLTDTSMISACNEDARQIMSESGMSTEEMSRVYGRIYNLSVADVPPGRPVHLKPIFKRDSTREVVNEPVKQEAQTAVKKETSDAKPVLLKKETSDVKPAPIKKENSVRKSSAGFFGSNPKVRKLEKKDSVESQPDKVVQQKEPALVKEIPVKEESRTKEDNSKRAQQAAELRDMMMQDDPEPEAPPAEKVDDPVIPQEDEMDVDWSASDTESKAPPPPKRSRRKVKKQISTRDAKGYLVTKDEWVWESCDESEVPAVKAPPILKKQPSTSNKRAPGIASFFNKKL